MSMAVWKFPLTGADSARVPRKDNAVVMAVSVPEGARFLDADFQRDLVHAGRHVLVAWALVDTGAPWVVQHFRLVVTGETLPGNFVGAIGESWCASHLATVTDPYDELVAHVFLVDAPGDA